MLIYLYCLFPLPLLLDVLLLLGCPPPIIDEIAAANAAVKFGSAVMAAVAALTVSAREGGCGWWSWAGDPWWALDPDPMSWDNCKPENFDWLYKA